MKKHELAVAAGIFFALAAGICFALAGLLQ